MKELVLEAVKKYETELIGMRRALHLNPELSYEEHDTTMFIVEQLEKFGYEDIEVGFGEVETGVCVDLNSHILGPIVALRADIDALPITDANNSLFVSQNEGVSHACGHDAHIAIMLCTAKILWEMKNFIPAHVRIIFQPGEECAVSPYDSRTGASFVRESGALEGVSKIFALHVWGDFPAGTICCNPGFATAAVAKFSMELEGHGGHGGQPHLAVDPVMSLCNVIQMWQQIMSREKNPFVPAVLSVGKIEAGTRYNIIPGSACLVGTCRALSDTVLDFLSDRMSESAKCVATASKCNVKFNFDILHGCVRNDVECVNTVHKCVKSILGEDSIYEAFPVMAGEDFAVYTENIPGALFFLGMKDESRGINTTQHDPAYKVNDEVLFKGVATLVGCVMDSVGIF